MLGSLCEKLGELTKSSTGNSWYFTSQERGKKKDQNQKDNLKLDGKKEKREKLLLKENNVKMSIYVISR